ncbi:MAG: O-antigen ligase family protein [Deltaproteobacteria bacterium]|nr:O-antigen ligase family protein [Deltaproteobacteria bacterium]
MTTHLAQAFRRLTGDPEPDNRADTRSHWALGLFAGHLLTIVALAASNVLLALAAIATPWRQTRHWLRRGAPLLLTIGLYLLCLGGAILASYDPRTSLRATSDLFNFLVPVVALVVVRTERHARLLIQALILLGSLVAVQALWQYALGANHLSQRPVGPFSHYMTLGGFLILVDCLLLAWMVFGRGWRRWWSWPALAVIHLALLTSYTRNAWVALAVILSLLAAVKAPRLLLAWIPAVVVLVILLPGSTVARVSSIVDLGNRSNYDRLSMLYAGAGMVRDKPIFGQGPRMARERYPLYRHPTAPSKWVPHLHNSFLTLAAERGLVSLIAMLALLWVPARRILARLRAPETRAGPHLDLYMGALLVLLATVITGMFEDYWSDTEIQRLVLLAAALPFCLDPAATGEIDS